MKKSCTGEFGAALIFCLQRLENKQDNQERQKRNPQSNQRVNPPEKHPFHLRKNSSFFGFIVFRELSKVCDMWHNGTWNRGIFMREIGGRPQVNRLYEEEKLLEYLKWQPEHKLHHLEPACVQMHCSRRQLQRVLKELCESGKVVKVGRGEYALMEE